MCRGLGGGDGDLQRERTLQRGVTLFAQWERGDEEDAHELFVSSVPTCRWREGGNERDSPRERVRERERM